MKPGLKTGLHCYLGSNYSRGKDMSLEKLIESYYAPKKGNELLIQLIESKLNESFVTGELTLGVGSGRSPYRAEFDRLLTTPLFVSIQSDKYFTERLDTIKYYLDPREKQDLRTDEFIATFIFLQEFDKILREYESEDPRQAGFKFETLFTVLFRGIQLNGVDITDAEIKEPKAFARFSYKFYSIKRQYKLNGSLYNLLRMMSENKEVVYFICLKNPPTFRFYSFLVTPENFYSILKKSTIVYNKFFSNYQPPQGLQGSELARNMLEHMSTIFKQRQEETTTELFDQQFLSKVYSLTGTAQNISEFSNTLASFEGDIQISTDIINDAKKLYREHELGKIGNLLTRTHQLNRQMLEFFAIGGEERERLSIVDSINDIGEDFDKITIRK